MKMGGSIKYPIRNKLFYNTERQISDKVWRKFYRSINFNFNDIIQKLTSL